jgi:hypothetical protein
MEKMYNTGPWKEMPFLKISIKKAGPVLKKSLLN